MDEDTTTHLRQVIGRLARQLNRSASDEGLTPSEASVLGIVTGRGPISLSELARVEGLNPTMLSRVVSNLERAGLISRIPDPNDLRSAAVSVTRQGRTVQATVRTNRAQVVADAAEGLTTEQQKSIAEALPALQALVDQLRLRDP